ncbi:multidrug transporter [Moraxella bovoculi]|uniref:Multidrug transporter n=1 Tax=Moraxella bovoculi TaxID=386891 RepID=A0AAC8PWA1_9GAMM|nr:sulfurtransferase complex subunit TusD [Moraxella bovoculi]AKG07921.1 multidrug transporter [Moraxella bovoculi]AKG09543.1 multidrug transporter [Moraxella bovoculi]AKG11358.1 multidrug transporter [Moraxella bovoculi]AKG13366.1 multidrug transporter [Moraxella bovoculi]
MATLLLITSSPHSYQGKEALRTAKECLTAGEVLSVFFYGDGAYTASRLLWQTADVPSISDEWVKLSQQHNLDLPVCVSTALARGITDVDNANRHSLNGDNLRASFRMVGLSELALRIDDGATVIQF